jgi:NTP pyrophosphatase (non-canonical NTP hydrolase)
MTKNSLKDFQHLMKELYLERDSQRGIEKTLLWLQSEQGELIDAYLKFNKVTLEEEAADVLAWLCSVCNLLEIDLDNAAWTKYPGKCPKCLTTPCECTFSE